MSFTIEILTSPSDAPVLGKIKSDAFETSTLTRYALCWAGTPRETVEKWYTDREEQDLQDPHQYTIISVLADPDTNGVTINNSGSGSGTVAGHHNNNNRNTSNTTCRNRTVASWARFGIPHAKPKQGNGQMEEPEYKKLKKYLMQNPPSGCHPGIYAAFRRGILEARERYLDEEKDYVLEILATSPAFERQGHASRLLKWGIEKAEADGARILLEATPAGLPLYQRLGWNVVDEMRIKLADHGVDAEGDQDGCAVLYIMIREPQGNSNRSCGID
ncbi:hypothetical protein PABG_00321 [Paracoccidioides brasiliensis Pb03]|nr:hypothetical protein PABG_00321 [Paracoccidioides brasiliensis Pb03]